MRRWIGKTFKRPVVGIAIGALAVLLCAAVGLWAWQALAPRPPPRHIDTNAYRVDVDRWQLPDGTRRPSLDVLGDSLILASNDGTIHVAARPAAEQDAAPAWRRIPTRIPTDLAVFGKAKEWGWALGVRDIFVRDRVDAPPELFALYGIHDARGDCVVTRVGRMEDFLNQAGEAQFQTLYDTSPCVPLDWPVDRAGGRLAVRDDQLYVTMGTPENDRTPENMGDPAQVLAQMPDNPYGKILRIDLATGAATTLTLGHRNPQGLFLARDGRIWITEHGPKGGDELNLVRQGANYGWPVVTYGTSYGGFTWPPTTQPGRHEGYERPVYAWVPSIGISQLIGLEDPAYGRWEGDLLVTSLNGNTVYRTRVEQDRVIFSEPIRLGRRLRDIAAIGGLIYIVDDDDLMFRLSPQYARD